MSIAAYVPQSVSDPTREGLTRKIAILQAALGGKVGVITIYFDGKEHVCWYWPLKVGF